MAHTTSSPVIDLTIPSPQKEAQVSVEKLRQAIAKASESTLREAITELCNQMPKTSKIFLSLLSRSPPRTEKKEVKKNANKKRKRIRICDTCGLDEDEPDGCCKSSVMQKAK
jgi:DNA gyrase/topoisomerase IV subunit B